MKRQEATKVQATLGEDHGGCEDFGFPRSYRQEKIRQHHRRWNQRHHHHCCLEHDEWFCSINRRPGGQWDGHLAQLAWWAFGQFAGLSGWSCRPRRRGQPGVLWVGSRRLPSRGDGLVCGLPNPEACLRSSHQQLAAAKLHEELDFDSDLSRSGLGFHLLWDRKFRWAHETKLHLHCESLL